MASPAVEARSLSSITSIASNPPAYPRNPTHVQTERLVLYICRVPGSRDVFLSPMKPREKVVTAEDVISSLYFIHADRPEDIRLVTPTDSLPKTTNSPIPRKAVPNASLPPRKPVPGTLAPVTDFENRQNINAANYSQNSPRFPTPEYSQRPSFEDATPPLPPWRPTDPFSSSSPGGTSLTLIRRDPASNAQWNVARIDDPPVHDVSSATLNSPNPKKKLGAPVYIEITHPGYSKFLNSERPQLLTPQGDLSVISQMMTTQTSSHSAAKIPFAPSAAFTAGATQDDNVFRRRLWMENGGMGHRKINSQDSGILRRSPRSSSEAYSRDNNSSMSLRPSETPPFLSRPDQNYSSISISDNQQSGFRGYVFMSPWNGRCEFLTGAGGGSLKCRHVVPGLQGANPMAMFVSELRFNLPTSSKPTAPAEAPSSKRASIFRPRHSRNNSAAASVSEMDLSLGQEFAGGGFGGKRAKLGKLIIEDEGLKMLDLLVAANMALWWRAYEKVDGSNRS